MTDHALSPLPELSRILWAARIDAFANQWHVNRRAIPGLKTIAAASDDPRLREAVKHAEAASALTDTMLEELRAAIDHVQPRPVAEAQNPKTT
jgi:hypothetical protein